MSSAFVLSELNTHSISSIFILHEPKIPALSSLVNLSPQAPSLFVLHEGTDPQNFQHFCALRAFLDLNIQHFVLHEPQI